MKTCRDCGGTKSLEEFRRNPNGTFGRASYCKPCQSARSRAHYIANRERHLANKRRWHLARSFEMTVCDYEDLLASQGGVCGICGAAPKSARRLSVDHDHSDGRIRGLLCSSCNLLLGQVEARLPRLLAYLDGTVE